NRIVQIINGEKAYYQKGKWYVTNTQVTKKPDQISWDTSKLNITNEKFLYTLEGFEPSIINNVFTGQTQFSIIDAVYAILLLNNQDFNTNKIKSILYSQLFTPFFVLAIIILIYTFSTSSSRFFNNATFISISVFITLLAWGLMFLLQKLALGGVVLAEIAIIVPLVILYIITIYIFNKRANI
ncbi:MAG: LptF/LptG family permease, partial [Campylobacterales bacterium]|nr:LptF/LptG family permease [Campylobacterales bacterium]